MMSSKLNQGRVGVWMGNISIIQELSGENIRSNQDQEWEKEIYQEICQEGQQKAIKRLEAIDEKLFLQHPADWKVIGFRERTLVARFGEMRIKRRLYQDTQGNYHFLLDEYLGLMPYQLATPDLQECIVELCAQGTFRSANQTLENLTAGVLSTGTVYSLVKNTAERAIQKEEEEWQAVFERGETVSGGDKVVPILFCEGDGIWIHLQQEEAEHYEIKDGIAYEGWEQLSGKEERYALVNKRVYCQANEKIPFWEGASVEWARVWNLGALKEIIIGGDGAAWIDQGIEEFAQAKRQLDGFHLSRASGRGWQEGQVIYEAIRGGKAEEARSLIHQAVPKEGQGAGKSRTFVVNNLEKGRDWRTQSEMAGRGLGTMESNQDKLIANRMKKRGLSWKISGALRMAKILQLKANGEIRPYCERGQPVERRITPVTKRRTNKSKPNGYQKWLEAGLPALVGPDASKPWVKTLRNMAILSHRLN